MRWASSRAGHGEAGHGLWVIAEPYVVSLCQGDFCANLLQSCCLWRFSHAFHASSSARASRSAAGRGSDAEMEAGQGHGRFRVPHIGLRDLTLLPVQRRDRGQELRRLLKPPSFPPRKQWGMVRGTERGGRLKGLVMSPLLHYRFFANIKMNAIHIVLENFAV